MEPLYSRHFTLEEAAGLIPEMRRLFAQIQQELSDLREPIVLYTRMLEMNTENVPEKKENAELSALLKEKWEAYQERLTDWLHYFEQRGIVVRELERGLIDFPYISKTGEEFLLCWLFDEEALFYFHDPVEGFQGRQPITLLPD